MPKIPKISDQDRIEARKVVLGKSHLFKFFPDVETMMPPQKKRDNGYSRSSNAHSQKYRSVEAAVIELLSQFDPQADAFSVDAKELFTDTMASLVDDICDLSDDPLVAVLDYLNTDVILNYEAEHRKDDPVDAEILKAWFENSIKIAADVVRGQKKYADHESYEPMICYRSTYKAAFNFMATYKAQIRECAQQAEEKHKIRDKFAFEPCGALENNGFWDSVRITIEVEKPLLQKIKNTIKAENNNQLKP